MKTTCHLDQRMNQRGITKAMIDCVLTLGEIDNDKYIINQRMAEKYIRTIQHILKKRAK